MAAWVLPGTCRRHSPRLGYPLQVIGLPKTVDNDLVLTDTCPGFGSVAKYVATSMREAGFDVASMARTSTRIFILEAMGRHAGWIAAAAGLASGHEGEPPHLLLFPEVRFDAERFLARVEACVQRFGYCTIAAAEGLCDEGGCAIGALPQSELPSHTQAGGVGRYIAELIHAPPRLQVPSGARRLPAAGGRATSPPAPTSRRRMPLASPRSTGRWPAGATSC